MKVTAILSKIYLSILWECICFSRLILSDFFMPLSKCTALRHIEMCYLTYTELDDIAFVTCFQS